MIERFIQSIKQKGIDFTPPAVIFDIGSRDCLQSIEFTKRFPKAQIFAFECNPNTIHLCRKNISQHKNIVLIEKAVNSWDGMCQFYPINQEKTKTTWKDGNPGASSLFKSNGKYTLERYVQDEIMIPCTRLDSFIVFNKLEKVDMIWMDLQGAELLALESLGAFINQTRYIYTEVTHREIYSGQAMFKDIHQYLTKHNFINITPITKNGWQENVVYINTALLTASNARLKKRKWFDFKVNQL